ncbi:MAG: putative sugar phosphate isomerase YwlF [Chloroflexi bacterium]|nr:putative sugar phosphate isomerase YwlF [Chloroflexota bacterium]MBT9165825.1 putative sugar phosphate isomerase YwlF [Chloroflexota bacterium]
MHIAIGSDHAGFKMKQCIKGLLSEMGHIYEDFGCYDSGSVDYPDIAFAVADAVAQGRFPQSILICGTGIGMSMAANKVPGIRAAICHNTFNARRSREHTDANVLCLGAWVMGEGVMREVVATYLGAEFVGGRHARRLEKLHAREQRNT